MENIEECLESTLELKEGESPQVERWLLELIGATKIRDWENCEIKELVTQRKQTHEAVEERMSEAKALSAQTGKFASQLRMEKSYDVTCKRKKIGALALVVQGSAELQGSLQAGFSDALQWLFLVLVLSSVVQYFCRLTVYK